MSVEETESSTYYTGPQAFAPVPLHVGSAIIRPVDKGKLKSTALETVEKQANQQISMLRKQAELIMKQVKEIETRVKIAEEIYAADMNFDPVIGNTYHLYEKDDHSRVLSMLSPDDWGKKLPFSFVASVKLLGDRTWEVLAVGDSWQN
ncbi:MAG: DUF2452 domain-containing protein [Bacteroidia bacterium]|jgi:hypothetical protein